MGWYSFGGGVGAGSEMVERPEARAAKDSGAIASLPPEEGGCGNCDGVADRIDSLPPGADVGGDEAARELAVLTLLLDVECWPVEVLRKTKLGWLCPGGGGNSDAVIRALARGDVGGLGEGEAVIAVRLASEVRIDTALAVK